MFGESLIISGENRKATKRYLTLPISLLIHAIVIASFIVVPLMMADSNLPEIKVTNVLISAPPPPPPPPAAKKKSGGEQKAADSAKKAEARPIIAGRLVAPIEVPTIIQEEDVGSFGIEGGVEGGVEVLRPDRGGEPVARVVGELDRLARGAEGHRYQHRAENLLLRQLRGRHDIGEQRRREEAARGRQR